jgi:predicted RNase H-like HicB family nuclease
MTTGTTRDETRSNIREAIQGHLETLRLLGDPIPEPSSFAEEVAVPSTSEIDMGI